MSDCSFVAQDVEYCDDCDQQHLQFHQQGEMEQRGLQYAGLHEGETCSVLDRRDLDGLANDRSRLAAEHRG